VAAAPGERFCGHSIQLLAVAEQLVQKGRMFIAFGEQTGGE